MIGHFASRGRNAGYPAPRAMIHFFNDCLCFFENRHCKSVQKVSITGHFQVPHAPDIVSGKAHGPFPVGKGMGVFLVVDHRNHRQIQVVGRYLNLPVHRIPGAGVRAFPYCQNNGEENYPPGYLTGGILVNDLFLK